MKRVLTGVLLACSLSVALPVQAAAPEKFQKDCVKSLSKTQRDRPRSEHETYCRCVTEGSQRIGLTRRDFAIERERLQSETQGFASGRMRQISAKCADDLHRGRTARSTIR